MQVINATELKCPEPLMLLRRYVRTLNKGESVGMLFTDSGTARDIPLYCEHMGHTLIKADTTSSPHYFVVAKGHG